MKSKTTGHNTNAGGHKLHHHILSRFLKKSPTQTHNVVPTNCSCIHTSPWLIWQTVSSDKVPHEKNNIIKMTGRKVNEEKTIVKKDKNDSIWRARCFFVILIGVFTSLVLDFRADNQHSNQGWQPECFQIITAVSSCKVNRCFNYSFHSSDLFVTLCMLERFLPQWLLQESWWHKRLQTPKGWTHWWMVPQVLFTVPVTVCTKRFIKFVKVATCTIGLIFHERKTLHLNLIATLHKISRNSPVPASIARDELTV